jgi:hypothetical protein
MKRIRNRARYRTLQFRRAKRSLRQRLEFRARRAEKRRLTEGASYIEYQERSRIARVMKRHKVVVAPSVLSVVSNPEQSLRFIAELSAQYERRQRVFVSLQRVVRLEYDAIVVLLAAMVRFKAAGIKFNGDLPQNSAAKKLLHRSGFFQSLYRNFSEQDEYHIGSENAIYTHANKYVDSELSARIIEHASHTLWGRKRRSQGVQRIFLELMQNTNNHASIEMQAEKHWWVSVEHREREKKIAFSFVDFGVGIFRSLDNKNPGSKWFQWRTKLFTFFSPANNAEILALMLDGQLHQTVTGHYFRGKGIPGIKDVLKRNGISKLVIVTNDVYADVSGNHYYTLKVPFTGTLVYWELDPSNTASDADA